jgi:hypothetical protein
LIIMLGVRVCEIQHNVYECVRSLDCGIEDTFSSKKHRGADMSRALVAYIFRAMLYRYGTRK